MMARNKVSGCVRFHFAISVTFLALLSGCASVPSPEDDSRASATLIEPPLAQQQTTTQGLFDGYAENRIDGVGNYITADLLLVSAALLEQKQQRELEQSVLIPRFNQFVAGLYAQRVRINNALAAQWVVLLNALTTNPAMALPAPIQAEREQIQAAQGIAVSPLWQKPMDYSQFQVRGYYTQSEALSRYFVARRYASSVLLNLHPSRATGVNMALVGGYFDAALALAKLIESDETLQSLYQQLLAEQANTAPEDLNLLSLRQAFDTTEPGAPGLMAYCREKGIQPRVYQGVVNRQQLEAGTSVADVLSGIRLLPMRSSSDSVFYQQLVQKSGHYTGQAKPDNGALPFGLDVASGTKGYPSVFEWLAVLGSTAAENLLREQGEAAFAHYPDLTREFTAATKGNAFGNDDSQHLLKELLSTGSTPLSMNQGAVWYTYQKYQNLLQDKQSYTLMDKSFSLNPVRASAMIEGSPIYEALLHYADEKAAATHHPAWEAYREVLAHLQQISKKQVISGEEADYLNELDLTLLELVGEKDHPIIVDIHTNPNEGLVVENGIGFANKEQVPVGGETLAGFRASHFEFKQPMNQRLNDESWESKLLNSQTGDAGVSGPVSPLSTYERLRRLQTSNSVRPSQD